MKTKVLSLMAVFGMALSFGGASASAASVTWDGEGADNNWSTALNWVGDVSPVNGDTVVFPDTITTVVTTNDSPIDIDGIELSDSATYSSITIDGTYDLQGSVFVGENRNLSLGNVTLSGDTDFTQAYNTTDNLVGDVQISGSLDTSTHQFSATLEGYTDLAASDLPLSYSNYSPEFNFTGSSTLTTGVGSNIIVDGMVLSFSEGVSNLSLATNFIMTDAILEIAGSDSLGDSVLDFNQSQLSIQNGTVPSMSTITLSQDMGFYGNLYGAQNDDSFVIGTAGIDTTGTFSLELSGAINLQKDLIVAMSNTDDAETFTMSGEYTGSGFVSVYSDTTDVVLSPSVNTSPMKNGNYDTVPYLDVITDDSASTNVLIKSNGRATINGVRGDVIVGTGGELRGTGTVANVLLQNLATLAPGNSPGCLATGDLAFSPGAIFEAEIDGATVCTEYDQAQVTGTVTLTGSTLNIVKDDAFDPASGTFTIISNDGADAVIGTFSGLAEGATVTVDGIVFTISYVGGDGNDVTLVANAAPAVPETGIAVIAGANSSWALLAGVVMLSGAAIVVSKSKQ